MFRKRPVIVIYDFPSIIDGEQLYLNIISSGDGKCHSFRCPNKYCGRPVKIGVTKCPFCETKLKWQGPFETIHLHNHHNSEERSSV